MDSNQRSQKNQSVELATKSFVAFVLFITLSCASRSTSHKAIPPEMTNSVKNSSLDVTPLGILLTKEGDNTSPAFSADGKKIVFVSSKRKTHAQPQIYFFDLEQLAEKRITYQDGESRDPFLTRDGRKVIYASSTDELKERPLLLSKVSGNQADTTWPPTDLYESDLAGIEVRRLTQRPGFDGFPWPRNDKSIIYSQNKNGRLEVWQLNLQSKEQIPLLSRKDQSIFSLRLSPNGKYWAWIESGNGVTKLHWSPLTFKEDPGAAINLEGNFDSVDWLDDEKLYLSGRMNYRHPKTSQIYTYELKTQCVKYLVEHSSNLSSPQINPTRESLAFSSDANGSKNIYYKSLSTNQEPCLTKPVAK